jgi:hypothetical protein
LLGSLRLPALVGLGAFVVGARAGEARAADDGTPAVVSTNPNRPPKFLTPFVRPSLPPEHSFTASGETSPAPVLAVGQTASITLNAEDPEGDGLTYRVHALPNGSVFDEQESVLTWKPTRDQVGKQEVTFEVTDGRSVVQRTVIVIVRANRAPVEDVEDPVFFVARTK